MLKKNEKILDKIIKKDYSNELEKVLETKNFKENAKNVLLNVIYKIENSYKDYEKVKREVENKNKVLEKLISKIETYCDSVKIVNQDDDILAGKSFLVEKDKKQIICLPIERKLLYAISKTSSKDKIINDKYFIIDKTLSNLINVGNNISAVEPIRDFNGYSWTTLPMEIESIEHNIAYQNILFLVGHNFLNRWIENKEVIIDYMEMFENKLKKDYGKEQACEIIELLKDYSILIEAKFDKQSKENLLKIKTKIQNELDQVKDNKQFLETVTLKKKELTKKIRRIDEILNNKELLQEEYKTRNEKLELNEKIFSIRILSKMLKKERDDKIEEIERLNAIIKPQTFVKYKKEIEMKQNVLKILEVEDIQKKIDELKLRLQKIFLKCFEIKMKKTENKQKLLDLIYQFRYYCMLPYNYEQSVRDVEELKANIEQIERELIIRAHKMKLLEKLSKAEDIDYEFLKVIFTTRIINLEEINIKLSKAKEGLYLEIYDGKSIEEKEELSKMLNLKSKDLYIMYNKKIKIFC